MKQVLLSVCRKCFPAVLCLAMFGSTQVTAADNDLAQRYDAADMVALVRITYVRGVVNRAMSMPGMMAVEAYSYYGSVTQNWKGAEHNIVNFTVSLSDCTRRLQEDQEYVVLSQANLQDKQQSFSCDNLVPKAQAEALIAGLDTINSTQFAHQLAQ